MTFQVFNEMVRDLQLEVDENIEWEEAFLILSSLLIHYPSLYRYKHLLNYQSRMLVRQYLKENFKKK